MSKTAHITPRPQPSQLIRDMLAACRQNRDDWAQKHYRAWMQPDLTTTAIARREVGLRKLLVGWSQIGETHKDMYLSDIGADAVSGEHFAKMGHAIRDMIGTADLGRYDGGTLDRLVVMIALACGVDLDKDEPQ